MTVDTGIGIDFRTREEFEKLFRSYYSSLCAFAFRFLQEKDAAEEVVQEVFVRLWSKKEELEINSSVKSYLYRSVRNSSLNLIKHIEIREEYKKHNQLAIEHNERILQDAIIAGELEDKIHQAINELPTERKKIFMMSRYDGLKYREIAEKLNISAKTVENQMGKAMKTLREHLVEYMSLALLVLLEYLKK